jgi:16S rRNA (cytidine1402-2'-O)-methyltransferase
MPEELRPRTLYIVSTPIGNLGDITFRAAEILAGVDLIAAEDTRTTKVLLDHLKIQKPLLSYFSYNELRRIPDILSALKEGKCVALVSDAGTPGISDPAYRVIRACLDENLAVIAIPGATALVPALIVSGLPMDRFVFEGFLPLKKGRATKLAQLASETKTIVLYESPHRIIKTLKELHEALGERRVAVSRELTKKFEETFRGTLAEAHAYFSTRTIRGEFVVVIEGAPY